MERGAQMNKRESITICRCEEVTKKEIEDAIAGGADTIDSVKRNTRAGMGLCQGRTCQRLVAQILRNKTGRPLEELVPFASRPPFRPVKLDLLAEEGDKILAKEQKKNEKER